MTTLKTIVPALLVGTAVASAQANAAPQSLGETGEMRRELIVCRSRSEFENVVSIMVAHDQEAYERFKATRVRSGECRFLPQGQAVTVTQAPLFSEIVCVRPAGEIECLWTHGGFVQKATYYGDCPPGYVRLPTHYCTERQ